MKNRKRRSVLVGTLSFSLFVLLSPASLAENELTIEEVAQAVNNLWVLVAGILVLMMQLGFAMLEAGLNESKNTVNVLFKNVMDACIGILIYCAFGYALMYRPENFSSVLVFTGGEGLLGFSPRDGAQHLSLYIDFFFQAAFAATAATICSGAVAGRIKPWAYLLLTILITGVVYPISGHWVWGGGWLAAKGFHDFAGSLVVHGVGGSAGLACIIILGPRKGRFDNTLSDDVPKDIQIKERLGHSLPLATLGMFILWVCWYGFNVGSALGIVGIEGSDASPVILGKIAFNTTISACSSALLVTIIKPIVLRTEKGRQGTFISFSGRVELSAILNGIVGGLVGITAFCDQASPIQSLIIGAFSGVLVLFGIWLLNKLKLDDAVGAFPVHTMCGIWGGIAVALFGQGKDADLLFQVLGSFAIPLWSFLVVLIFFYLFEKLFTKIRVDPDEQEDGLDIREHNEFAYTYVEVEKKIAEESKLLNEEIDRVNKEIGRIQTNTNQNHRCKR